MKKINILIKIFVFVAIVFASLLIFSQKAQASPPNSTNPHENLECHWVSSAQIICTYNTSLLSIVADRSTTTDCGGINSYTCVDFWFAAEWSSRVGYPVFRGNTDKYGKDRFLAFTTNEPNKAVWYQQPDGYLPDYQAPPAGFPTNFDNFSNFSVVGKNAGNNNDGKPYCSLKRTTNCDGRGNTSDGPATNGIDASAFIKAAEPLAANESALRNCNDQAPVGFLLCPILDAATNTVAAMIGGKNVTTGEARTGLIAGLMQLPPLLGQNSQFGKVVGNVITIANIIYVLVFLILIFSSALPFGLDNYTIKKTLPKLIAAVILTQFTVVICSVVVDFFNILGNLIPNVILFLNVGAYTGNVPTQLTGSIGNTVTGGLITGAAAVGAVIGWILVFILALVALVAVMVGIVYMIIRYMVLYVLVLIAPLAFVAWVIPGTEKFFTNWWKNFIRLNAMYVTIMGMLATALLLSSVLQTTFPKNSPLSLIPSMIPLVALILIPKTLKWTTQGMSALAGGALGFAAGKMGMGAKPAKQLTQKAMKSGKEGVQNRAAESKFGQSRLGGVVAGGGFGSVLGTRGSKQRIAARQGQLRSARNAEAAVQYAQYRAAVAAAGDDGAKKAKALNQLMSSVGGNKSSQFAMMAQAAQAGDTDVLKGLRSNMSDSSWSEGVTANYPAFDKVAPYRQLQGGGNPYGSGFKSEVSKLTYDGMIGLGGGMQEEIAKDHFDSVDKQLFIDAHADTSNRSKLSVGLRQKAHEWASALAGTGNAQADAILEKIDSSGNYIDTPGPTQGSQGGGTPTPPSVRNARPGSPVRPLGGGATTGGGAGSSQNDPDPFGD